MRNLLLITALIPLSLSLISCGGGSGSSYMSPSVPSVSYSAPLPKSGSLSENSVSSVRRTVVKTGSMDVNVGSVKEASTQLEDIVAAQKGYMTSMSKIESDSHHADYEIRVPAQNLVKTMDAIAVLGDVDSRRVWVTDETDNMVKFEARLADLKNRRDRFKKMLSSASETEDKIKVEQILSELELEIFEMELGVKQMMKHAKYSKLSVDLDRKRIRGPIGLASAGWGWSWRKLFTIRD